MIYNLPVRSLRGAAIRRSGAFCAFALAAVLATPAAADNSYNANMSAHLTAVLTYFGDTRILFTLDTMPSVPNCTGGYFVIPAR